ncbi:MAG: hypothetical protein ACLRSW_10080 [Christensenellaceae bacterium]
MDSASIGEYLGVKETNTKFGIMFDCTTVARRKFTSTEKNRL